MPETFETPTTEVKERVSNVANGRVLMIAFHYPPLAGSSGILRTLKFSRHLPKFGWDPTILTVAPGAYERTDPSLLKDIPAGIEVVRAKGFDTKRQLSFRGFYPQIMSLPDRWMSWIPFAVAKGRSEIRKHRHQAIFSTYPIASAVVVGYILRRMLGLPWVVDLRDSMSDDLFPPDPTVRKVFRSIERKIVKHASAVVFTTPSAKEMYLERYPQLDPEKCFVIQNGYDEEDFASLATQKKVSGSGGPIRLLHAGLIYPLERDPRPFFRAIGRLKSEGRISATNLQVNLRASGNEAEYQRDIEQIGVGDIVKLLPPIPYREVLREGAECDGLLLFQAANCNHQIPAKAYEYMRLGKPVFALTDRAGDTAKLLTYVGGATVADLADEEDIARVLPEFLAGVGSGSHSSPTADRVREFSRESEAQQLAQLFTTLIAK